MDENIEPLYAEADMPAPMLHLSHPIQPNKIQMALSNSHNE